MVSMISEGEPEKRGRYELTEDEDEPVPKDKEIDLDFRLGMDADDSTEDDAPGPRPAEHGLVGGFRAWCFVAHRAKPITFADADDPSS